MSDSVAIPKESGLYTGAGINIFLVSPFRKGGLASNVILEQARIQFTPSLSTDN